MFWEEKTEEKSFVVPDDILDLSFKIDCKRLPLDHAYALSQALLDTFPWLGEIAGVGIHLIHGAESGNGWQRPANPDALIHLSRRARFVLRIPKTIIEKAEKIPGTTLDIAGFPLKLGSFNEQLLVPQETIFARYVITDNNEDDNAFLQRIARPIEALGVKIKKMLSGNNHVFQTPDGTLHTRSLMLSDLEKAESIALQQHGLGDHQLMGMGLFLPHKGIKPVSDINEDLLPFVEPAG